MEHLTDPILETLTGWAQTALAMLPNLAIAAVLALISWFVARWVRHMAYDGLSRVSENEQLNRLSSTLVRFTVLGAGLFLILSVLNLDKTVTSLLAGVGIAGVALGLALQQTAANLFTGVSLAVRRPFRIGDVIEVGDVAGVVEDVDLRTTTLKAFDGAQVILLNQALFEQPLLNRTRPGTRRVEVAVGVGYDSDLDRVRDVAMGVAEAQAQACQGSEPQVLFTGFGGSSIDLVVRFRVPYERDHRVWLDARSAAIVAVHRAFTEAGIDIPFPIRTLQFDAAELDALRAAK